ncbi:MAG: 50S ribosomal protein L4 [Candidatus Diapherotrites archaeon]|nr:50S ribosomal protein L4 [Candidatus Diapherotrites archaeon]
MKASVSSLEGQKVREMELPKVFESPVNEALIKRAVLSIQSQRIQPNGPNPRAGRENTAIYVGSRGKPQQYRIINTEHARLPRLKNRRALLYGRVASVSQAVSGPRAHKLNPLKVTEEKINRKEKRRALESAVAATADAHLVKSHGHAFDEKMTLPIVVEDKFESLQKTSQVCTALKALKLYPDVEKAKKSRKIRAGKGRVRARKYKHKKSILIVAADSGKIYRAARNLEGVDIVSVKNLNAEMLAPGSLPGRLTVWTEKAIQQI